MEPTPIFRYLGNTDKGKELKPFGLDLIRQVRQFMSFQGLKIHAMKRVFADGAEITATNIYGIETVYIYYPVIGGKEEEEEKKKEEEEYYVVISSNVTPIVPTDLSIGTDTYSNYPADKWSIVWDIAKNEFAKGIRDSSGNIIGFPCLDSELDYWRNNKTEERNSYGSIDFTTFDWPVYDPPWTTNPDTPIFRSGAEGVMCNGDVYHVNSAGYWLEYGMAADRIRGDSELDAGTYECYRAYQYLPKRSKTYPECAAAYAFFSPGTSTHLDFDMSSPLGAFERFAGLTDIVYWGYYPSAGDPDPTDVNQYYPAPDSVSTHYPAWTSAYPSFGYYAGYSDKAHLQIFVIRNTVLRYVATGGDPSAGWEYSKRAQSKIQIHAGSRYTKGSGTSIDPFTLSRNSKLETALLDLIQEQLYRTGIAEGEDFSLWELDPDLNPEWPQGADGSSGVSWYDSEAQETYVCAPFNTFYFQVSFRKIVAD